MTPNDAWASFMLGLVCAYRRPDYDHGALASHMQQLLPVAAPRFQSMGAQKRTITQLLAAIQKGRAVGSQGMPALGYARLLVTAKKEMREGLRSFYVHPDVPEKTARCVRGIIALLSPDTATVDRKDAALDKSIVVLPDRVMRLAFSPTARTNQAQKLKEASLLVRRMVGRTEPALKPTETKDAKAKNPETYKQYLRVRAEVNAAHKDFVRGAARDNGGPVKIGPMVRDMRAAGIAYHPYDNKALHSLYVGEDGFLYTPKPHRHINASIAPGSKIVMNPNYDPRTDAGYVFKYQVPGSKRDADDMSAAYTKDYVKGRKGARFALVSEATQNMPKLRSTWTRDLRSRDVTTRRLAAMTEMLYVLAMRIGGKGNSVDDVQTYGLSTLLVNHVAIRNGNAVVQYPGKDAIQQKHVLSADDEAFPENALVIRILADAIKGKRGTASVWTDARGNAITSGDVRAYMKGKKLPIGPHKFRHIRGSVLMKELLDRLRVPRGSTQMQVEKLVKQNAIQVGMLLGHMSGEKATAATSIKNYISPDIISTFFREKGLRVPQWVPKTNAE